MAILCCCGKLRSRKRPQDEQDADLPVPPPPAKLPAPALHPSAISPGSTLARSSLTNPLPGAATDASVYLGQLVVEESDDDNVAEDLAQDSRNRSTSTLQAVKSRIRRHLSQDSLQRQSETEEQIAHRAEVKRLMRKRIQEELQNEVDNVPSHCSTPQQYGPCPTALPGNGPRDTIEFTVDESHKSKELTPIKAACVAETDEVERRPTSKLSSRRPSTACNSSENENRRPTSLVASEPDWMDADSKASHIDCHIGIRERSSLPDMPNSPVLVPVRGSVFHDASSLASWRLSLSADKLADLFTPDKRMSLFRPLANTPATRSTADLGDDVSLARPRSKSSPLSVRDSNTRLRPHSRQPSLESNLCNRIPASKSLIRDESPVGLWLRTQSMPFRASITSQPQSEVGSEEHNCTYTTSPHGKPDNELPETPTKPSRLRIADTSQHVSLPGSPLDSRSSADTTRQSLEASMRPITVQGFSQEAEGQDRPRYAILSARPSGPRLVSPGPDLHRRSTTPPAIYDVQVHPNEILQPHPHRRGISGLRLPSFKWSALAGKSQDADERNSRTTPPLGGSTTGFANLESRRATIEAGSETSSFLRREAVLQNVEERFRDSHLRKGSFNPVESKFREIFDHDGETSSNNRMSLLSKLHLNVPKRAKVAIIETLDGNSSGHALAGTRTLRASSLQDKTTVQTGLDHAHLQVPDVVHGKSRANANESSHMPANSSARSRRLRGFSSSREGDDTAELWKRAVRAETESRSPRGSISSNLPAICLSPAASDHGRVPRPPQPSGAGSLSSSRSDMHSPLCKAHPELVSEAAFRESLRRSTTILEDWAHQIETQERGSQHGGERSASASFPRHRTMNMPPASWAKFPSYNRDERNAAAGVDDKVRPRDFAVKNVSASGNIAWTTDRMEDGPPCQKGIARTFSDKFSHTFKSRLSKLIPGRSRTPSRDRSIRGERRSSIQTAGDLEYPELEILSTAGGYRELRALEAEIHDMKGIMDTTTRSTDEKSAASQRKPSLAEQMATVMLQHDGSSDPEISQASDTGSFLEAKASFVQIRSPETPALQIRYPDTTRTKESSGSTVDRYATPLSHLSSTGKEASSSGTPDIVMKLVPSAHSPSSVKSATSLIRRSSVRATSDVETSASATHTWQWQSQDAPGRRPVPMLTARASG